MQTEPLPNGNSIKIYQKELPFEAEFIKQDSIIFGEGRGLRAALFLCLWDGQTLLGVQEIL